MKKSKTLLVCSVAFCAAVVGVIATSATAVRPIGGGCNGPRYCLDVWRPVICSNGVVYSNDCYAARACATGCVPYGGETE